MRKKVFGRKFSRDYGSRQALLRALMRALVLSGSIKTSKAKAKGVQPDIDALVNLVKQKTVSASRQAYSMLGNDREVLTILTENVAPLFANRNSGFTRIIPLSKQAGDASERARLEWVEKVTISKKEAVSKKKKVTETAKPVAKQTLTEKVKALGKKKK
jgi:large subunit ribosomal protein L17